MIHFIAAILLECRWQTWSTCNHFIKNQEVAQVNFQEYKKKMIVFKHTVWNIEPQGLSYFFSKIETSELE